VKPQIHHNYDGRDVTLSAEKKIVLSVRDHPLLAKQKGKTLLTTDGTTLLGADNKAGIAEIMAALQHLMQHPRLPRPKIRVLFTPDEEVGRGTEHITAEEIGADYGYTIDGEKLGELEDETFCADSVDITVHGLNVHPGYAKNKLVNAIKIAAQLIDRLPHHRLSPETTEKREGYIHPHQISGNVEKTVIKLLIRDFTEQGLKDKESLLKKMVDQLLHKYPKAGIDLKVQESYRNMKQILDQHPQVLEKAEMAMKRAGVTPNKSIIRGGTDGARLSFMGLPTPNIFTGGSNFHSIYEWITLEDMNKAAEVIVHLIQIWTEVPRS
jgi:tripeptide aminopeptidase